MKCRDCGTTENLKKDSSQKTGYRTICYSCDSKRQRIKKNGYDTGGKNQTPKCKDCGEKDLGKLCPDNRCYMQVKRLCKSCAAKRVKGYRKKTDKYRIAKNNAVLRLRQKVLAAYGHKCAKCDEKHYEFLAIDHVNNNGAEHRKRVGSSDQILRDIVKEGFPNTYQILCHNHNNAKEFYKRDPIQIEKEQLQVTEGFMGEGI